MEYEPLRLVGLSPVKVSVFIDVDGDGKTIDEYVACEASEGAHVEYKDSMFAGTKFTETASGGIKPSGFDSMSKGEPTLVARCLFKKIKVGAEEKLQPVLESTIRAWPHRIVEPIPKLIKQINGVKEGQVETIEILEARLAEMKAKVKVEEDAAKNSSSATTATSV